MEKIFSGLQLQAIIGIVLGFLCLGSWWLFTRKRKAKQSEDKIFPTSGPIAEDKLDKATEITLALEEKGVLSGKEGQLIRQKIYEELRPKPIGKYLALAFTSEGIKFPKIPERVGSVIQLEPSMPKHGTAYLVVQNKNEDYESYDPRLAPVISKETPQRTFDAVTPYPRVNAVYANKFGLWDKINVVLIAIGLIVAGLVAIVALDKL